VLVAGHLSPYHQLFSGWFNLSRYNCNIHSFMQYVMMGISPPVTHRVTSGLDTFSSGDDSDIDIDRDDPFYYPILWGPEDEVYHDNALVYTMPGPCHVQVNSLFD
jgi:hypothetical protein